MGVKQGLRLRGIGQQEITEAVGQDRYLRKHQGQSRRLVLGVFRILKGWPLHVLIVGGYVIVVLLTFVAPPEIVGIAYDSGGVTTSTVTVPLVTALGVGLASSIRGRNPLTDGFGLIAFASMFPMIFVMLYGMAV